MTRVGESAGNGERPATQQPHAGILVKAEMDGDGGGVSCRP